jgi:fimbrial chaperone protein
MLPLRRTLRAIPCAMLLALPVAAFAQGFAALVSPPRFELAAKPGEKVRDVIEITNASAQTAKYRVRTADWTLAADASVTFDDTLKPGSCRPWVAIESRQISVSAGGKYRYRFEVAPPADAPAGECRLAILIEGDEQQVQTPGGPAFPIAGRLGVIIYVTLGGAEANLEVVDTKVAAVNGEELPVLMVRNSGNAHGRLAGFLSGTDAAGAKLEFTAASLPILPGETRAISLAVYREKDEPIKIAYPITIRGKLEWGGKSSAFERRFAK